MNQKQLWHEIWRNLAHEDQQRLWAGMMSGKPEEFFDDAGKHLAEVIDTDILESIKEAATSGVSYRKNGVAVNVFEDCKVDFIEVIERRDKITDALIVLLAEAKALRMFNAESKIREAGRALEDELHRLGELSD